MWFMCHLNFLSWSVEKISTKISGIISDLYLSYSIEVFKILCREKFEKKYLEFLLFWEPYVQESAEVIFDYYFPVST